METKNNLYDIEIERNVIGSILSYSKALDDCKGMLCVDSFSEILHRRIYAATLNLYGKGDSIDIITVMNELRRMGFADENTPHDVTTISNYASGNYYYSAQVLHELLSRRKIWDSAQLLLKKAGDLTFDISDTISEHTNFLSNVFELNESSVSTVKDALIELYENNIKKNLCNSSKLTGSPTGFNELDSRSGGLQPGNLIIVAAETSQGKTSFAMSIAVSAAKHGDRVSVYSMEMKRSELAARMAACETGLKANKILYSPLCHEEIKIFDSFVRDEGNLPIYFDDNSTSNIDVIISSIRKMVAKYKIKGVVIDYLQILNVNMKSVNKEQQMGEVARRLKNLAKDMDIWIIALSQLSRDITHVPSIGRLRDSGQIAEASDIVILLHRPEVFNENYPEPFKNANTKNTAMVSVAKGRNIGLLKFIVGFESETTRFYDLRSIPPMPVEEDFNPF